MYRHRVFNSIFAAELVAKVLAFSVSGYWRQPWNRFDCILVVVSFTLKAAITVSSTSSIRIARVSRVVRVIRALRALRTMRFAARLQHIRLMAFAFVRYHSPAAQCCGIGRASQPGIWSCLCLIPTTRRGGLSDLFESSLVCCGRMIPMVVSLGRVLAIVSYVYAVAGCELFVGANDDLAALKAEAPEEYAEYVIDDVANFDTLQGSFLILLQMFAGCLWSGAMNRILAVRDCLCAGFWLRRYVVQLQECAF